LLLCNLFLLISLQPTGLHKLVEFGSHRLRHTFARSHTLLLKIVGKLSLTLTITLLFHCILSSAIGFVSPDYVAPLVNRHYVPPSDKPTSIPPELDSGIFVLGASPRDCHGHCIPEYVEGSIALRVISVNAGAAAC